MDSEDKLPPGWIKVKSKSRSRYYFYHKERKISVWKLEDCNDETKIGKVTPKTPKKTPTKEQQKVSKPTTSAEKRNIAYERLSNLQNSLRKQVVAERGSTEYVNSNKSKSKTISDKKELPKAESQKQSTEVLKKSQEEVASKILGIPACRTSINGQQPDKSKNGSLKMETDTSTHKKKLKKSPIKKEQKLSSHSITIGKRNIANERLKNLQNTLHREADRGCLGDVNANKLNKKEQPVEAQKKSQEPTESENVSHQTSINGNDSNLLGNLFDESIKMEVDEQLDKSTDSLKDYEPMDWEDIDEKFVVEQVQNIRTKEHALGTLCFNNHNYGNKLTENGFYVIVDTNVLISNLPFVKEIKGKLFKDIGTAFILLPYIVLSELDRLKLREESIARLARAAISFIDECFKHKDEYLIGQSARESSRELIEIDSGDDYIVNCALQIKESTSKVIVLSNDKNLRNKAFVNGFEAFSSDMLNYANYNLANTIKFE